MIPKTRDDRNILKNPFVVSFGDMDFTTYREMVLWQARDELYGDGNEPQITPGLLEVLNNYGGEDSAIPVYYTRRKCRDTSLGGNDAINCYYQYNETDDPFHAFTRTDFGASGMGRTYSEEIDDAQQLVHLSFGIPIYTSMAWFYNNAVVNDLANLMNKGSTSAGLGHLIGTAIGALVKLPVMPLIILNQISSMISDVKITKYYDFRPMMAMYYRMVNSVILHLMVNMGFKRMGDIDAKSSDTTGSKTDISNSIQKIRDAQEDLTGSSENLPDCFQYGVDMYRILHRKYQYSKGLDLTQIESTDEALMSSVREPVTYNSNDGSWLSKFWSQFKATMYDAHMFIAFRVEKSVDASESVSNTTGESEIGQMINSKVSAARNARFGMMEGNVADSGVLGTLESVLSGVGGMLKGFSDSVGATGLVSGLSGAAAMATGAAYVDIPEVWQGSNFTKSHSFNVALRAPYGDPMSILMSIYVPLAMLLVGGLPRAAGTASYCQPFLIRAYSKGMFAVPLGMIDSMTIKRGSEQHGWNFRRLPTCIDVSFTIKDLSPAMYIAVGDGSLWQEVFGANSSFQEYLLTLSGMGLGERLSLWKGFQRRMEMLNRIVFAHKTSAFYWGMTIGDSMPMRILSSIIPVTTIPNN